jgi:hypothetical protein
MTIAKQIYNAVPSHILLDVESLAIQHGGVWVQDTDDDEEISGTWTFSDGSQLYTRTGWTSDHVSVL